MDERLFRLELAHTGTFGADGNSITKQDLKDVVDTFDGKAPISLGHYMTRREDWWPSWGNVNSLMLTEDGDNATLIGDISIKPELADALLSGYYPGWSVSIPARAADGKRYLHHLAFLGAVPPAIRDLKILGSDKDGMPEDAIKLDDLTAFGDDVTAYYSFADLGTEPHEIKDGEEEAESSDETVETEGNTETAENQVENDEPVFSDNVVVNKARKILEGNIRARVKESLKGILPENRMNLADDFCDACLDDYDFSDEEHDEPEVIRLFMTIADAISKKPQKPKTGRMDFSDVGNSDSHKTDDAAKLAAIF